MSKYYYIETFGCQMNVHESEKLAGCVKEMGYEPTDAKELADIIIFNTCCIRDTAENKILGNIGELKALKREKKELIVVIVGCMTQQEGKAELIKEKFPFVDIILGTTNTHLLRERIEDLFIKRARHRGKIIDIQQIDKPEIIENTPVYRTSYPNAWVNIMYGCNNFCTYCIVPFVRGRERSRAPQDILNEVKALVDEGYKEITLLGQNVDSYGSDRDDGWDFARLLDEIGAIPTKFRLRFMTSHPKDLSEKVIATIVKHPNICNNIHLPVQAGSNNILKAMNRKYTREKYFELVDTIKKYMPDCGITSDVMVGFPGETEEDFLETLDLVEKVRYSNAFTFIYSPRKGTVAAKMEQIPYAIKKERITRLIELQNRITCELSATYVGNVYEVLVEDVTKAGLLCGRTESGRLVNFAGDASLIGQFVNVKISRAKAQALWGDIIYEEN